MAAPPEIERAFEETFKIIFGQKCSLQIDELKDYLLAYHHPAIGQKSSLSGKSIALSSNRYSSNARFISQEEAAAIKPKPLNINQLKDLDSLLQAAGEQAYYAGNKVFGASQGIEESDCCTDGFHVYRSHNIEASKYVAYSSYIRENSEYIFGSSLFLRGKYLIKAISADALTRCFETYFSTTTSDAFFCYNCVDCSNIMFSFSARSKRHCIGNLELPKDKYLVLKKKLVAEIREYIEKHKKFYSIYDFTKQFRQIPPAKLEVPAETEPPFDIMPVQQAFETASKVILGKPIGKLNDYENFLQKHPDKISCAKSMFGNKLYYSDYFRTRFIPKERFITACEIDHVGKLKIDVGENENLDSILKKASSIAFYSPELKEGNNHNLGECPIWYNGSDGYRMCDITYSKKCAYCTHTSKSEAIFGSSILVNNSKYCIRCHDSYGLTACMDCDSCSNCSYCYFCHNCEGSSECMFCFNSKSLRYAIGNVIFQKEEYMRIKNLILSEICSKLQKDKKLELNIYNIGCK